MFVRPFFAGGCCGGGSRSAVAGPSPRGSAYAAEDAVDEGAMALVLISSLDGFRFLGFAEAAGGANVPNVGLLNREGVSVESVFSCEGEAEIGVGFRLRFEAAGDDDMTVQPSERAAGSEDDLEGEWAASLVTVFASGAGSCSKQVQSSFKVTSRQRGGGRSS